MKLIPDKPLKFLGALNICTMLIIICLAVVDNLKGFTSNRKRERESEYRIRVHM